jgi:hemin uptake protein HemP
MKPDENQLNATGGTASHSETYSSSTGRLRELTSEELLCGQQEVCIRHGEEIYRLRVTRNGKLILHK